jgi:hypothetical protein
MNKKNTLLIAGCLLASASVTCANTSMAKPAWCPSPQAMQKVLTEFKNNPKLYNTAGFHGYRLSIKKQAKGKYLPSVPVQIQYWINQFGSNDNKGVVLQSQQGLPQLTPVSDIHMALMGPGSPAEMGCYYSQDLKGSVVAGRKVYFVLASSF